MGVIVYCNFIESGLYGDKKVDFSEDGNHLVSVFIDKSARVWSVITGKIVQTLKHKDRFLSARFIPSLKKY